LFSSILNEDKRGIFERRGREDFAENAKKKIPKENQKTKYEN
jgi:hypothetical protein